MKSLLLTTVLLSSLIIASSSFINNETSTSKSIEEPREDYGCLHESHSQYDDGDGLNLEAAAYSNNN